MAKGARSTQKKAIRAIRRHAVTADATTEKRDAERFARIQESVQQGKAAREEADRVREEQRLGATPMDTAEAPVRQAGGAEKMDVDAPQSTRFAGIPLTKKKKLKLQSRRKKKVDGINQLHKKKGKGKKKR